MHLGTSLRKLVRCSSWISFAANKFSLKKGRKKVGGDISSSNHQIVDPPTPGTQRRSPFETFRLNDSTCQTIQDNARQYNKGNTGIIYDADQSQTFFFATNCFQDRFRGLSRDREVSKQRPHTLLPLPGWCRAQWAHPRE